MSRARQASQVLEVFALRDAGLSDASISARTGVPLATTRAWRRKGAPRVAALRGAGVELCEVCGEPAHDSEKLSPETYAFVLGAYLGDGCVLANHTSWTLRFALDAAYPGVVDEWRAAAAGLRGQPATVCASRRDRSGDRQLDHEGVALSASPARTGKKHDRPIALEPWQQTLVDRAPGDFLRGLIHTDGWRGINWVVSKGKVYEYPRYQFSNRSDDIRRLFTAACEAVGVKWRPWTRYHVSVAERASVALLDTFVGPEA